MDETGLPEVLGVVGALEDAGCRVWVAGGWGVDVLLGRRTRAHRDLDLAIDAANLAAGLAVLTGRGYQVETDWRPVRIELHRPRLGRVDLHPVSFDGPGDGVQSGFDGEVFRYPAADLVRARLDNAELGCLSARLQLVFRQGYELRAQDHHDLPLLRELSP